MTSLDSASVGSQGVHHHRPHLGDRLPHGAGAGEARHGRAGGPRPGEARTRCGDHRAEGHHAVSVVCDLSDLASVRRAAARSSRSGSRSRAWSTTPASWRCAPRRTRRAGTRRSRPDHLGPFALTEALMPHLPDGANVVFVCSAVEDPERRPAGHGGVPGRPLHLGRGERARRVAARWFDPSRRRRLRDVEAVQPGDGAGVRARDAAAALQRRRAGVQPGHEPRPGRNGSCASC